MHRRLGLRQRCPAGPQRWRDVQRRQMPGHSPLQQRTAIGPGGFAHDAADAAPARLARLRQQCLQRCAQGWTAPLYWEPSDDAASGWALMSLHGLLPVDPAVTVLTLDNGVTCWIRPHGTPAGKVTMWLHMHSGSLNEADDQRGLAELMKKDDWKKWVCFRHRFETY